MKTLKVKLITGFREDQYHTIEADEAHKAYWLFLHPEQRGIFNNGVAIIGKNIQGIEPDYHATMGWNPTHQLENEDWTEIRYHGVDTKIKGLLQAAKEISPRVETEPTLLNQKLSEIAPQATRIEGTKGMASITEILDK